MLQEATLETYFPSWEAIRKHEEVVKFICGLMADPRLLVDHVHTAFNEDVLEEMRASNEIPDIDTSLLESLYQASAVPLPDSALHNQHVNYYDHYRDDLKKIPRDTTPVFTPSKLYVFDWMEEDVTLEHRTPEPGVTGCTDPGQSEPNSFNNQECAIWINEPYESLTERLLSLCRTISASQPVTDFHLQLNYDNRYDLTEANVPIMSKEAMSLVLENVDVSSSGWNYLLQHESLQALHLESTHLHDGAVPLIFNHRNLKVLSLWKACMSHEMCKYACHHLGDLVHLEHIDLSYNNLSRVSSIRLSNTTSPVTLKLGWTYMSPELLKSICQLPSVVKLKELDLSRNTLTGCLHHLLSEARQGLQSLEELNLGWSKLNKNDIWSLTHAMQRQVLPRLKELDLQSNILDTMQRETEELIRTCVTRHQRELTLWLKFNDLSKEVKEKWKRLCQDTHIELEFRLLH